MAWTVLRVRGHVDRKGTLGTQLEVKKLGADEVLF
jgi:hypothetical protein